MLYPYEDNTSGNLTAIALVIGFLGLLATEEPAYKAIYKNDLVTLKADFTKAAVKASTTCTSPSIFSDPKTIRETTYTGLLNYTAQDGWPLLRSHQASIPAIRDLMGEIKLRDIVLAGPPSNYSTRSYKMTPTETFYNSNAISGEDTRVIAVYYNGSKDGHEAKTLLMEGYENIRDKKTGLLKSITDHVFSQTLAPGDVVVFARRMGNSDERFTYTLKNGVLDIPTINPAIYGTVKIPPNPCHN